MLCASKAFAFLGNLERRIIDVPVWGAVRARLAAVRARYTGNRNPAIALGRVTN